MPGWERKYMGRWKMPNDDYILRSDALKAILGVSIYDTIEELEGARTIAESTWADGLYDAYKIIEEEVDAANVEPMQRWIPVTERLPESTERYLVMRFDYVTKTPFCDLLWFENGRWWNRRYEGNYAVTHWMPLPEPPKEADE